VADIHEVPQGVTGAMSLLEADDEEILRLGRKIAKACCLLLRYRGAKVADCVNDVLVRECFLMGVAPTWRCRAEAFYNLARKRGG